MQGPARAGSPGGAQSEVVALQQVWRAAQLEQDQKQRRGRYKHQQRVEQPEHQRYRVAEGAHADAVERGAALYPVNPGSGIGRTRV